jgi:nuclear GTP-binding protein
MPKSFRGKQNGGAHKGAASDNPNRTVTAKAKASGAQMRSTATINRLNMYRTKVKRNKDGKIVKGGLAVGQSVRDMKAARVQPDRRWFGNTRVIGQKELTEFREQMAATQADPYAVLIKRSKLPMGLLADGGAKKGRVDLLRAESYESVFGKKAQRKRPKLSGSMMAAPEASSAGGAAEEPNEWHDLLAHVNATNEAYLPEVDSNIEREVELRGPRNYIFDAGQSRRIRAELFKVRAPRVARAGAAALPCTAACPGKDGNHTQTLIYPERPARGSPGDTFTLLSLGCTRWEVSP